LAVAAIVITTGAEPHEKVITPPLATAATTAAEVQLPALPLPTTVVGCEVSTACPAAGTAACPPGFPNEGTGGGDADADDDPDADADVTVGAALVFDDDDAAEEEDDTADDAPLVTPAPVAETEAAELAATPPRAEPDDAEPQAAALIAKATATTARGVRKGARLVDTRRD
jgi:hypothetical protein